MVRDPVCGMEVNPEKSNWVAEHNGENYYFCSENCQKAFMSDPARYTQIKPGGHNHNRRQGHMGGCCGVGMGRGWLSYVHLGIMIIYILLLMFRS
jgi:YHS domain-containing protein